MARTMNYKHTLRASYIGYIVQSLINTFVPLLFVTFQTQYEVSLTQISILIMANFGAQIVLDFFAAMLADRIGYRPCVMLAHFLACGGLIGIAFLPEAFANPFIGLLIPVIIYGAGGGLTEVLLTPIVQACPIPNKDQTISMLHSFYCWGSVIVILGSSAFFALAGIDHWKILAICWAMLPLFNAFYYSRVPMYKLVAEEEKMPFKALATTGIFWLLMIFMFCAGSCEMAIAQWASDFAEEGLHVSKVIGDLLGPCTFGALKGVERLMYAKKGDKIPLWGFMLACSIVCAGCYIVLGLAGSATVSLIACAVAGFVGGVMWPGTFTIAAHVFPKGGTALFGFLALFGDVGCGLGPMITGAISDAFGGDLKVGFLFGTSFAILMIIGMLVLAARSRDRKALLAL